MTATTGSRPPIPLPGFLALMVLTLAIGFVFIRAAYATPWAAAGVLLVLSFGATQLWTWLFGHFLALSPNDQYPSFWWGDLVFLPVLTAVPLSILAGKIPSRSEPYWFESPWWSVVAGVIAVAIAVAFRWSQLQAFPGAVLITPWKLWHDIVVYTLFAYFLVSAAPAMWYSDWGLHRLFLGQWSWGILLVLMPLIGISLWGYAGTTLDRRKDLGAPIGHVQVVIRGYDWNTGETSDPLLLDDAQRRQNRVKWVMPASWFPPHRVTAP